MELILASTSPYRRALLERLGIPFRCVAPPVDEDVAKRAAHDERLTPRQLAERLARMKAESIAADESDAVVIGGDQLVALDGDILGKPGTAERAVEQLLRMAGRTHELITAIAVAHAETTRLHTDITRLRMRSLTRPDLERYVAADRPLDCAGSYKIECRGITLFEEIRGDDQTAITGLPLMAVTTMLCDLGFAIP